MIGLHARCQTVSEPPESRSRTPGIVRRAFASPSPLRSPSPSREQIQVIRGEGRGGGERMSLDNWWRGPRSSGQSETSGETSWPHLSPRRQRSPWSRRMKKSPSSEDLVAIPGRVERNKEYARGSAGPSERDHVRFPGVERTTGKRKLVGLAAFEMRASPTMDPDRINLRNGKRRNVKVLDDAAARNSSKKARRNAEIDVLDSAKRRRSVTGSQTASSAKFPGVKLNLSLSIRSPQLDVGRVFQCSRGKESQFTKAGSIAEFKRDVLKERERKRRMNVRMRDIFDAEKIQAMSRSVSEIDFDRLKIGGDSHDGRSEVSFVRNMSSMTLFDGNYRKPKSDCGTADDDGEINYARPEMPKRKVAGRLKNFLIQKDRDAGSLLEESSQIKSEATDFVDSDMATKAHCLKICDETGETVGEFEGN